MRLSLVVPTLAVALVLGCAGRTQPASDAESGRVISADQIARMNAHDAVDVLERIGGYSVNDGRDGVAIRQRRGRSSITTSGADRPVVVLDNIVLTSLSVLHQVEASQIDRVVVLSSGDATARYGTGAGAGAILIFTRAY